MCRCPYCFRPSWCRVCTRSDTLRTPVVTGVGPCDHVYTACRRPELVLVLAERKVPFRRWKESQAEGREANVKAFVRFLAQHLPLVCSHDHTQFYGVWCLFPF